MSQVSRRKFIYTAGITAVGSAILHGCTSGGNQQPTTETTPTTPTNTTPATGDGPEVTTAKLGFIA
ncbi:MAG: bicarbonate-binding protein, partial [Cyanobacteria bacterium]|nr:bicarbonate-binding protein [Cyanobacteria bacterium CG_2015-09_32_10]